MLHENDSRQELLKQFEETSSDLLDTLDKFNQYDLNIIPFEGSWTAGQVAEHILKSISGMPRLFLENIKPTERPDDEKIGMLREVFLDFKSKFKAREAILPGSMPYEKKELQSSMENGLGKIKSIIQSEDLSVTCLNSVIPVFGEMTRLEWSWLVVFHIQRHIRQLKKIAISIEENQFSNR